MDFIHELEEDGVKVSDGGPGESFKNAGGNVAGAGAHEGALWYLDHGFEGSKWRWIGNVDFAGWPASYDFQWVE